MTELDCGRNNFPYNLIDLTCTCLCLFCSFRRDQVSGNFPLGSLTQTDNVLSMKSEEGRYFLSFFLYGATRITNT